MCPPVNGRNPYGVAFSFILPPGSGDAGYLIVFVFKAH